VSGLINGIITDLPNTALRFDSSADPILYLGEAQAGSLDSEPKWRISRIDVSSGVVWQWAGGEPTFRNVWNDRATLSYS
jgi:hypothetical protein